MPPLAFAEFTPPTPNIFFGTAYGDLVNENLSLGNAWPDIRSISVTIDNDVLIEVLQATVGLYLSTATVSLTIKVKKNNEVLKVIVTDTANYPLTFMDGNIGTSAFTASKGDVISIECAAPDLVGVQTAICTGSLIVQGRYI